MINRFVRFVLCLALMLHFGRTEVIERLELRLLLSAKTEPQMVRVKVNDILLADPAIEDLWSIYRLTPQQLAMGRNLVMLDDASFQSRDKPLVLEKVEVHVRYRK